jgi:DNA/RNA endonuclease G (NUC1)
MKKFNIVLLGLFLVSGLSFPQTKRDSVLVKTSIFTVMYSETKEQPLWVKYTARPIKKVADRKGLDFHTEEKYHTSDSKDYYKNVWDKGHMAPAAPFYRFKRKSKTNFYLP